MADRRLQLDTGMVLAQIANLLSGFPELKEDADLLASAIEGETDFDRVMERIADMFLDRVAMKEAMGSRLADLQARLENEGRAADWLKALMFKLMMASEQTVVRLPIATISIRTGKKRVVIADNAELPQGFYRTERVPLKTELLAALEAGDVIEGATLERGQPALSVRTK